MTATKNDGHKPWRWRPRGRQWQRLFAAVRCHPGTFLTASRHSPSCHWSPLLLRLRVAIQRYQGMLFHVDGHHQPTLLIAFSWLPTSLGVVVFALLTRWRCKCRRRDALPSATGRFRQQQLEPGTVYLPRLKPPTHCCSSRERQKRTSSTSRFWTNLRTIADSRTPQCSQHACLNYVQSPCNVSMWQCQCNLFLINNNNNHHHRHQLLWDIHLMIIVLLWPGYVHCLPKNAPNLKRYSSKL